MNPVVVRKILGQLKAAGIVTVARGTGGAAIARPLEEITLTDVCKDIDKRIYEELSGSSH